MPAVLTHDFFGRDMHNAHGALIGTSTEQRNAFLLGNQGPDPLFYLVLSPTLKEFLGLGSKMHHEAPSKLIAAFKESLSVLSESEHEVGRAYALGFLCHYSLDRAMHPLVYSQEFAICDAGIEGLDRSQGNEVHAEIEREFDEMVLFTKTGKTIRDYRPYVEVLHASSETLATIGKMYAYVLMKAYGVFAPRELFGAAVRDFRTAQRVFYSPTGRKQNMFDKVETEVLSRSFSFYKSMSHRDKAIVTSDFDNREHANWENPFTGETSTNSFWDIYEGAQGTAASVIASFDSTDFDEEAARALTRGLDFSGEPVE